MKKMKDFYILWSSQSLSQLGSSTTAFALTLWLFEKTGLALNTALLAICTYAPYVLMSIFAGAISDHFDKKKTMLVCDTIAAISSIIIFYLYKTDSLLRWHLYLINIISGLMNSVQQPASEVAMTLLVDKDKYQLASSLKNLSRSIISILNPLIATALYGLKGLDFVLYFDLFSYLIAFNTLLFFIDIPHQDNNKQENVLMLAKEGISFLKKTPLIFTLILFMSSVNLVASGFDAALPAYILPNINGGTKILGIVTSCAGIAMVVGSLIAAKMPKPKDRVRVIYLTMLFSLGTENFLMPLSNSPYIWCISQVLGWLVVPIMSTNLEIVIRHNVPLELQGRVYACRNTFQYFTIPIGLYLGGYLTDNIFEPLLLNRKYLFLNNIFGFNKGAGAALMIFVLGIVGVFFCLIAGSKLKNQHFIED